MKTLYVSILSLITFSITYSQDITATLAGNTSAEGFSVVNAQGDTVFRITGEGNVGIGTTLPVGILDVHGGEDVLDGISKPINIIAPSAHSGGNGGVSINIKAGNGGPVGLGGDINLTSGDGISNAGDIILQGEFMRSSKIKLLNSHEYTGGSVEITGGDADWQGGDIAISAGSSQFAGDITITAGDVIYESNPGGDIVLTPGSSDFGPDGLVRVIGSGIYTGTWTQSSDERFKKNANQIQNVVDKVEKLNGISYEFKSDEFPEKNFADGKQIGLIAQEVEKVFPELVRTDEEGYKSVAYQNMVAVLIEAIKEQQQSIDKLNDRVKVLERELIGNDIEVSYLNK